jgi:FtsH-binding integral membrane protein
VSAVFVRRRSASSDVALVGALAAGLAHFVAAPAHFGWWPASGVFFVVMGIAQFAMAGALFVGTDNQRLLQGFIWGTVGVVVLYVVSRTVGLPGTPPVPMHGTRWIVGRSMIPGAAKRVGSLDLFTLIAELVFVVAALGGLTNRARSRTVTTLMWLGFGLWVAAAINFVR